MDSEMAFQTARLTELFVAKKTYEWLLAGVSSHVEIEVSGIGKLTATDVTVERSFACVAALMSLELGGRSELLGARSARHHVACVHADVPAQGKWRRKGVATPLTGVRLLASMESRVCGQWRAARKCRRTIVARKLFRPLCRLIIGASLFIYRLCNQFKIYTQI